jgi:hypothetical protein
MEEGPMEQLSPNEVANLFLSLVTLPLLIHVFSRSSTEKIRLFFPGFLFMLGGNIFTLVEEFVAPQALNALEHLCYALAGWSFLYACTRLKRTDGDGET